MSQLGNFSKRLSSTAISKFRKVTHVIFDNDGTLLDTEDGYTETLCRILKSFGKTFSWKVKENIMGLRLDDLAERIISLFHLPITVDEYKILHNKYTKELLQNSKLKPDTEPIYEDIIKQIAKSYDRTYPLDVRMKIMGTPEKVTAEIAVNDLNLPITVSEFSKSFDKMGFQLLGQAELKRGAERLVKHLFYSNIPICLATSSRKEMVEVKIKNYQELYSLFHHQVCGTDPEVKNGKPAPDIFLVAASRFPDTPKPENCLVFEDAPNGVKAAKAAGMQVVMTPDDRLSKELCSEATLVLPSLCDFNPEDFGLPPYQN